MSRVFLYKLLQFVIYIVMTYLIASEVFEKWFHSILVFVAVDLILRLLAYLLRPSNRRISVKSQARDPDEHPAVHVTCHRRNDEKNVDWMNKILASNWPKYSSLMNNTINQEISKVFRKLRKDNDLVDGMVLKFYQNLLDTKVEVDVGDIPPKIIAIRTQKRLESDVVFDFKVGFESRSRVFVKSIYFKFLIKNVTLENILLRVRARFVPLIPFGANLSISVLEPIDIGWGLASTNFLEDFKAQLDGLIEALINRTIKEKVVGPTRKFGTNLDLLTSEIRGKLDDLKLPYIFADEKADVLSLLMPEPSSVLRVTVVKGNDLKYRDEGVLSFVKFLGTKLESWVTVSTGAIVQSSRKVAGANPEWNFSCDFPLELPLTETLNFVVRNEQLGARPVLLGQSTQSLERIYQDQPNREWINISTSHPSKILVETVVIPLTLDHPRSSKATQGVLCIVVGHVKLLPMLNPWCKIEIFENFKYRILGLRGTGVEASNSAEEHEKTTTYTLNMVRMARIENLFQARLRITVGDSKPMGFYEENLRDLMDRRETREADIKGGPSKAKLTFRTALYTDESEMSFQN